ncbi:MAG: helix-turn-helix transcriptional regulator [Firmicutes bacterium]|nr:helix-turn-helix transcriptional regulator [Bacillota bacterium]
MKNRVNSKRENYLSFIINYHIILLIPMLIVAFSTFFVVRQHNLERVMTEVELKTESQSKYWDQEMSVILLQYNDCRYSKVYSPASYGLGFPVTYLDIMQDLRNKEGALPFVDKLYFYNMDEQKIFSSEGTYEEDIFFDGRCRMDNKILDEAKERGMAAGRASFYAGTRDGMVIAFSLRSKLEMERTGSKGQYLLVTVSREKLMEQFAPRGVEGITAITWQDEVLYQSTDKIADWSEDDYEIYRQDVANGFTIWNLASKKEIISDSVRYLKSYVLWIGVSLAVGIVLALFYSRKRYVIFQDIVGHSAALEDEKNALQAESCLYELLTLDIQKGDELWEKCLASGVHVDRKSQYIILFPKSACNEDLKDYFVAMKREDGFSSAYKINLFGDIYMWLVLSCEEKESIEKKLDAFAEAGARFERGAIISDIGKIKESYEMTIRKIKRTYSSVDDYPRMEMEALKDAVALGEESRVDIILREIREIISESEEVTAILASFETLYMLGLDSRKFYALVRNRSFSRQDVLNIFDMALEERRHRTAPKEGTEAEAGCRKRSITDVLAYLHEHYLDPGFSAKYMAASFDTSVSNLSHFFKKNMGVSISAYVDQIKLEKAKQLLRDSDMKVGEIAELLQYGSSTGFAVMFKKYEGMTPKEYRENL